MDGLGAKEKQVRGLCWQSVDIKARILKVLCYNQI